MTKSQAGRLLAVTAIAAACCAGCVRRTVKISTAPEGAAVMLNDQPVGTTPVTVDFTWYGDYSIILRKDGYETIDTNRRLETPWYELPGIDFISENLMPFTIHDKHELAFEMEPREPVDSAELLEEAVEFRERALFGSE